MLTPECEWCSWLDVWEEETFTDIRFKSPIDSLDEDSLRLILLYLPIRDRVRCEGVCKRWRRVSRHIWKSEQKLCIEESGYCWWFPKNFLCVLLSKTGGLLRQLDFSRSKYDPCRRFGKFIASECKNLEELNLSSVCISNTHLRDMAGGLSKLKKFIMDRYVGGNKGLDAILKANPGLEYLSLDGFARVTSKGFFHISSNLKVLRISYITDIWPRGLKIILKRNPGLEELEIYNELGPMFQLILDSCRKLKTLSLCPTYSAVGPLGIHNLGDVACQRELEKLSLRHYCSLTDDSVRVIASTCLKLVEVDLKGCRIGNNSLKWLSYLPSLRCLDVSESCVNDEGMKELATRTTLLVFKASRCNQITNEGVVALLESNPNMNTLDVGFVWKVNDNLLPQLTRILSSRTSLDALLLLAHGTSISRKAIESMDSKMKALIHFYYQSAWEFNSDTDDSFNDADLLCDYDADDCFNDAYLSCDYDGDDYYSDENYYCSGNDYDYY